MVQVCVLWWEVMVQPLRVKGRVNVLLETRSPEWCRAALHNHKHSTCIFTKICSKTHVEFISKCFPWYRGYLVSEGNRKSTHQSGSNGYARICNEWRQILPQTRQDFFQIRICISYFHLKYFPPPVRTCGLPQIEPDLMYNMTVRPGERVVFNCKVGLFF